MDFVQIRHDGIEGTGMCSREAFDLVYAEKGWQIVDDEQPAATDPAGNPAATDPASAAAIPTPTTPQES